MKVIFSNSTKLGTAPCYFICLKYLYIPLYKFVHSVASGRTELVATTDAKGVDKNVPILQHMITIQP